MADDSVLLREGLVRLLTENGHDVVAAVGDGPSLVAAIEEHRPDVVLILPWNLEAEITNQLAFIREWGGRFLVPIPEARLF